MAIGKPLTENQWELFFNQCHDQMDIPLDLLKRLKNVIQFELEDMIISKDGIITNEAKEIIETIVEWSNIKI